MENNKIVEKVEALVDGLGEVLEFTFFDLLDTDWNLAAAFLGITYEELAVWMEADTLAMEF